MVFSALSALWIQGKSSDVSRTWFLDLGASNHIKGSFEYLHNLQFYHGGQKIQIVDSNILSITDVGDINSIFLDVLVSSGLASNLLFFGQLVDMSCAWAGVEEGGREGVLSGKIVYALVYFQSIISC